MFNKKMLATSLTAIMLTACGGGSGSGGSDGTSVSIQGKAIDGYIQGATVFLDLDFDKVLDSNEPHIVTVDEGDFELVVGPDIKECVKYVPVVVDVPIGAIDLDKPEEPIQEAYQMVIPPEFALTTDSDLKNVTPLTSVIWSEVESELRTVTQQPLSCQTLIKGEALRKDIAQRLRDQEVQMHTRYNITAERLYGDYIDTNDTEAHTLAKRLIPGLQKTYKETKAIRDENPSAIAFVEFFLGEYSVEEGYEDKWYRRQFIQPSTGNYTSNVWEMSEDLETRIKLFSQDQLVTVQRNGINVETAHGLIWDSHSSNYQCASAEALESLDKPYSYGINNTVYLSVEDWNTCKAADYEQGSVEQTVLLKTFSGQQGELTNYSHHTYNSATSSGLEYLIGDESLTKAELIAAIKTKGISHDFYDESDYGTSYWFRTRNQWGSDPTQVVTTHDKDGNWQQSHYFANGTHKKLCGQSEETLVPCE
ncbi:hypothetical protein [Vibrio sp. THAF190c]|uniref:hypothetical protein n=1 Tax=Vibrio sp. THAF190c TaxID=2587865 RepID=UPI0012679769|nr:hypothetical protein [Vibrio sp. THAF190c]QFT13496.1 hypothetical protein FIV04_26435 [Vibrio sp. THAF190c]